VFLRRHNLYPCDDVALLAYNETALYQDFIIKFPSLSTTHKYGSMLQSVLLNNQAYSHPHK